MIQPIEPLGQISLCCGLGKRRGFVPTLNGGLGYFGRQPQQQLELDYGWASHQAPNNPYLAGQPARPYYLVTQPVIIAGGNAAALGQAVNSMNIVHQAQATNLNQLVPFLGAPGQQTATTMQPASFLSSQYAIYNSSAALNTMAVAPAANIYEPLPVSIGNAQQEARLMLPALNQQNYGQPQLQTQPQRTNWQTPNHTPITGRKGLNSDVFKRLEAVEKQVDLSRDIDLIEKHGIVITRALNPYSLMPHLNELTLSRYQQHFLMDDEHVIKFVEIIKRPGQTLGLYIRTVQFEDLRDNKSRPGVIITKIDSDSPIYESQVLQTGDEIISVNLIDVQNMNLDDVVVIMSIPKRLVLAIRIPRHREHHFETMANRELPLVPASSHHLVGTNREPSRDHIAGGQMVMRRGLPIHSRTMAPRDHHLVEPASIDYTFATVNQESSGHMTRDLTRNSLANQDTRDLYRARPVRVQSAIDMNEANEIHSQVTALDDRFQIVRMPSDPYHTQEVPISSSVNTVSSHMKGSRHHQWTVQSLDRSSRMREPNSRQNREAQMRSARPMLEESNISSGYASASSVRRYLPTSSGQKRSLPLAHDGSEEAVLRNESNPTGAQTEYKLDFEIEELEREAMKANDSPKEANKLTHPSEFVLNEAQGEQSPPNHTESRTRHEFRLPSPMRHHQDRGPKLATSDSHQTAATVPTLTTSVESESTNKMFNRVPVLGGPQRRLDEPVVEDDRSNYMFSSIEAINRELREMRNQAH